MEIIRLADTSLENAAQGATEVLRAGDVVLYPTDTLYGLGADAFSDAAVEKVQEIKARDKDKPIHCIVADMHMAERYADISADAKLLAATFLPGPLTLILKKKKGVNGGVARRIETIGIRIPDNDFCIALAHAFGKPYTTTSANVSGEESKASIDEIVAQLGERVAGIDLAVDAGRIPPRKPSTIVDLSRAEPVILREGAISAAEIWETISTEPKDIGI